MRRVADLAIDQGKARIIAVFGHLAGANHALLASDPHQVIDVDIGPRQRDDRNVLAIA